MEYLRQDADAQVANILHFGLERRLDRELEQQEERDAFELIHELLTANILMPALDRHNHGWPWLSLTAHGREVLQQGGPPVYDYEAYLRDLRDRVGNLDEIVLRYISEALRAYQGSLYFSAVIMLGCASERSIKLLIDRYTGSIADERNRARLESRVNGRDISRAYEEFRRSFDSTRHQVRDAGLVNDYELHVDGVFTFIRLVRNSIVHPGGLPQITHALVYANLQQFSYYVETVFRLIEYYGENRTVV